MVKQLVCTVCGYAGSPKRKTKGNFLIEVILWIFFIIPGLIYSIWRVSSRQDACPKCGNASMIPQDTPQGQRLISEQPQVPQMTKEELATQEANRKHNRKVLWIVLFVVFGLPIILGIAFGGSKLEDKTKTQPTEQKNQPVQQTAQSNLPTDPQPRIESLIKNIGDYEVTIWDAKSNLAKATTKPPYEVIINAGNGKIANCSFAKNVAFEIMKNIYTDETIKDKMSRVIFTSWGNLRVSVGAEDGVKTDWKASGPTNFWKVMMKYKPYEDETGALNQRTWGKAIATDCN